MGEPLTVDNVQNFCTVVLHRTDASFVILFVYKDQQLMGAAAGAGQDNAAEIGKMLEVIGRKMGEGDFV